MLCDHPAVLDFLKALGIGDFWSTKVVVTLEPGTIVQVQCDYIAKKPPAEEID